MATQEVASQDCATSLPRILNTPANRVRRPPPGIRTSPLPSDQRYFPPGPQKVVRVPTRILRRKESEYERGSLRLQSGRDRQSPRCNLVKEVEELQYMQDTLKGRNNLEVGSPNPQDPHISQSQVSVDQNEQDQVSQEGNQEIKEKEELPPDTLDFEELMEEETEVKSAQSLTSPES